VLNEDYQDGLGLTSLAPDVAPTRSHVEAALAELQSGGCPPATRAGDSLPVSNGVRMQYIVDEPYFAGLPRTVTLPVVEGDACPEPYYEACVPDHPGPNGTCTNATFVGDRAVTGYATFRVCHVTGPSVSTWPPPGWPAECGAAPGPGDFNGVPSWPGFLAHSVFLQLVCGVERDGARAGRAGCGQFGTSSPRSTLVQ